MVGTAGRPVWAVAAVTERTATQQALTALMVVTAAVRAGRVPAVPVARPVSAAVVVLPETPATRVPPPSVGPAGTAVMVRISAPVPVTVEVAVRPAPARRVTALRVRPGPQASAVVQAATGALAVTALGPPGSAVTVATAGTEETRSDQDGAADREPDQVAGLSGSY